MEAHSEKRSMQDLAHNSVAIAKGVDALAAEMRGIKEVLEQIREEMIRKKE